MFNKHDLAKNEFMLDGPFAKKGYDWWWHSLTAINEKTGEEKPFFIEYFVCNPALGGKDPIYGQLPENKENGVRPSYLMVKAGCWGDNKAQLHRFFGWNDVKVHKRKPYSVKAADCYANDKILQGSISITEEEAAAHPEWMCDAGEITWDLKVDKQIAYNVGYGTSTILRLIKAFEMYWHAEGIKTLYSGEITYNGEKYIVTPETSYGYADKNWGSGFTSPWVWLSSCNLTSTITGKKLTNSAFDIGGGKPKIYFLPLNRKLLGCMYYEGQEYEFNFSKFWMLPKTKFNCYETDDEIRWHVTQSNKGMVLDVKIKCKKKDMLWVNYEAPDGSKRHNRLWNGGNGIGKIKLFKKTKDGLVLIDEMKATNIGCEYGEYDPE